MPFFLSAFVLLAAGSLVGVELGVAVFLNPVLGRLPRHAGIRGRADAARVLGRTMPYWYCGTIALTMVLILTRQAAPGTGWLVGSCTAFVVSIVMSALLLVPINNRVKGWTTRSAPADWSDQVGRWDRLHLVRVAVLVSGFVALSVGLLGTGG